MCRPPGYGTRSVPTTFSVAASKLPHQQPGRKREADEDDAAADPLLAQAARCAGTRPAAEDCAGRTIGFLICLPDVWQRRRPVDRARWLYTAITRAEQGLVILS